MLAIGVFTGVTTVVFGFGGGFMTVPVVALFASGQDAPMVVAVATSSVVMVVNAAIATVSIPRSDLRSLRDERSLLALLAAGGVLGALAAERVPPEVLAWGFVAYLLATIVDALVRPGFVRPATPAAGAARLGIGWRLGAPIGAVAALLGVGGSVMTVPLLRRSGAPMSRAAMLANPLTLCIALPSSAVFLVANAGAARVDVTAAALLLGGAIPTVLLLRRRPPVLADRWHVRGYLTLLVAVLVLMTARQFA